MIRPVHDLQAALDQDRFLINLAAELDATTPRKQPVGHGVDQRYILRRLEKAAASENKDEDGTTQQVNPC